MDENLIPEEITTDAVPVEQPVPTPQTDAEGYFTPSVAPMDPQVTGDRYDVLMGPQGFAGALAAPDLQQGLSGFVDNLMGKGVPQNLVTGKPVVPLSEPVNLPDAPALMPTEVQMKEKVGTDATTQVTPSAGAAQALRAVADNIEEGDRIARGQQEIAYQLGAVMEKRDAEKARAAEQIARDSSMIMELSKEEVKNSLNDINRLREELQNTKWESYWGNKTTADKLMVAMAVGLGAYGQAKLGGKNIAMELIQSQIEDHNLSQKNKFDQLTAKLTATATTATQKQAMLEKQSQILAAKGLADADMINKQFDALASKVKTAEAATKIAQLQQENKAKQLATLAQLESDYKLTSTQSRDVFRTSPVDASKAPVTRAGEKMDVDQRKEIGYVMDAGYNIRKMEKLEDLGVTDDPAWGEVRNALINEARSLGALAGTMGIVEAAANFGRLSDKYVKNNPALAQYLRFAQNAMEARLRKVTGATIGAKEYMEEIDNMLPKGRQFFTEGNALRQDVLDAQKSRRNKLIMSRDISMSPAKLWFEGEGDGSK